MNKREERYLKEKGIDITEIEQTAYDLLDDIKNKGKTLEEAKLIVKNMGCILERSERYSPRTPLSDILLKKTETLEAKPGMLVNQRRR